MPVKQILMKLEKSRKIIEKCKTDLGFQSSPSLYGGQYWTRDLFYSIDTLLDMGLDKYVKSHIQGAFDRQKGTGEVPTFFVDFVSRGFLNFVGTYIGKLLGGERNPFSDLRHLSTWHEFVCDDELTLIISLYYYVIKTGDCNLLRSNWVKVRRTIDFVNSSLEDFMVRGSNWYDAMSNYEGNFCFMSQVLLYRFYSCVNNKKYSESVREKINSVFWSEKLGYYVDSVGSTNFDLLGHSMALLFGIIPKNRKKRVIKAFGLCSTKHGYRNVYPPLSESKSGFAPNSYQNSSIWMHVQCYAIMALMEAGEKRKALEEFLKMTKLSDLNEWYDPKSGRPKGSSEQLWSAASYIRAFKSLGLDI